MKTLPAKIKAEIADNLSTGLETYFNIKTQELISIPDFSQALAEDEYREAFEEDIEKIEAQIADLIHFELLAGFESFKIMERFVGEIADERFRNQIISALENRKPFRNFNYLIDNSDCRQQWFDFKQQQLEEYVGRIFKVAVRED